MILKFKEIKMYNFMSYSEAEINLSTPGFTLIKGYNNNRDDASSSNGSGKSAIWEALSWALTGTTLRGNKDVVRFGSEDGCYVELDFIVDNDAYKIIRSKNHSKYKTNLFIYKNNDNISGKGIRDTEKLLSQYLPELTSSLIHSVILLGQGLPQKFSSSTPSGRKELLEMLSKSDYMIDDLKSRISKRMSYLQDNLRIKEDEELKLSTKLDMISTAINNDKLKLDELLSIDTHDLNEKKETYLRLLDKLNADEESLNTIVNNLSNKLESLLLEMSSISESYNVKKSDSLSKLNTDSVELTSKISSLSTDISNIKSDISKYNSVKDICPTCGQKIPGVVKIDTSGLVSALSEKELLLSTATSELDELQLSIKNTIKSIDNEYNDKISSTRKDYDGASSEMRKCTSDLQEVSRSISNVSCDLQFINNQIDKHDYDISALKEKIELQTQEYLNINSDKLYISKEKEELQNRLSIVNKFNTAIKRDFRGYLLSNVISYIDRKSKEYCKSIFNTELIKFCLDGNAISISYNGKEYESLSGGERQKIDLIIQFSIRDMLCNFLNFSCNILVLDEITDNLDSEGCDKILNFIIENLSDIESVYIISHRADSLQVSYDNLLSVVKDSNGISSILEN